MPVALIRWATTGQQQTLVGTLQNIAAKAHEQNFAAPAIAVFGEVVSLREKLQWFEGRELSGKKIVVTRTRSQAGALSAQLRALGADVFELPTIEIQPPTDLRAFAELVQDAHAYDWIVFTSPNGVTAFFDLFYKLYDDAREIGGARIAAIGPGTAQRVRSFHMHVDLEPEEFVAEGLVRAFQQQGTIENLRILLARAEQARDVLPKQLTRLGAIVDEGFAYRTVAETRDVTGARRRFVDEGADLITFTSSSTVENFLALGLEWPKGMQVASIGPITSKTARERGLTVDIEARRHDISGLSRGDPKLLLEREIVFEAEAEAEIETTIAGEFASAMQELSAEAEKKLPETTGNTGAINAAVTTLLAQIAREFYALNSRIHDMETTLAKRMEELANPRPITDIFDLARQFKRVDAQLDAIRNAEGVNQRLFDSMHHELKKYRDNFLHESLQKPFIRDLIVLFDDLTSLSMQLYGRAGKSTTNALHSSVWRTTLKTQFTASSRSCIGWK